MHKRAVRKICALLIYNAETVQTLKQWKEKENWPTFICYSDVSIVNVESRFPWSHCNVDAAMIRWMGDDS